MDVVFKSGRAGYTVVELMVTMVIVSVLTITVGALFARLLTIQEKDREEAYMREKLCDICGAYADMLSVGTSVCTATNLANSFVSVEYRREAGGVSLETGIVSRVAYVTSQVNATNRTMDVDVYSLEQGVRNLKIARRERGDAHLLPLVGDIVSCTIKPLNHTTTEVKDGCQVCDATLGYLQVSARYKSKNDRGEIEEKDVKAGRVVRLWNRQ